MAFTSVRVAVRRTRILPKWVRRADAAAGRAVNRRHTHPNVDRFWMQLTSFADNGVLWWTLAGVLAVTRRRRASVRGLLSLLGASALTNLIAKQVFGGDRPLLADVPIGRHLPKHPTTPSFPSGHSASAAAFATGVALERPRIGAAIAPVALGVAYSRMHTGAHWLSDVVGGLALGAAVAGVGALVVPPRPGAPELPKPTGVDRPLPASPDGEGLFIVVNRSSGTSVMRADPLRVIADRLPAATVHVLEEGEEPRAVVRAALRRRRGRPRILGVCGGDGSVAAVAHVAVGAGLPLLVVPGGTFNHFARTAGAASVDLAIDALQRGEGVRADVAELAFGDHDPITVLNTASVGIYPDFVAVREQLEERWGKWLAAVISAMRVLRPLGAGHRRGERTARPRVDALRRRRRQRPRHRRTAAAAAARRRRARRADPARGVACACRRIARVRAPHERGAARPAAAPPAHRVASRRSRSTSSCDPAKGSRRDSPTTARSRSRRPRRPPPRIPRPATARPFASCLRRSTCTGPRPTAAAGERPGSR